SRGSWRRRHRLRSATATARFARCWPMTYSSRRARISLGVRFTVRLRAPLRGPGTIAPPPGLSAEGGRTRTERAGARPPAASEEFDHRHAERHRSGRARAIAAGGDSRDAARRRSERRSDEDARVRQRQIRGSGELAGGELHLERLADRQRAEPLDGTDPVAVLVV